MVKNKLKLYVLWMDFHDKSAQTDCSKKYGFLFWKGPNNWTLFKKKHLIFYRKFFRLHRYSSVTLHVRQKNPTIGEKLKIISTKIQISPGKLFPEQFGQKPIEYIVFWKKWVSILKGLKHLNTVLNRPSEFRASWHVPGPAWTELRAEPPGRFVPSSAWSGEHDQLSFLQPSQLSHLSFHTTPHTSQIWALTASASALSPLHNHRLNGLRCHGKLLSIGDAGEDWRQPIEGNRIHFRAEPHPANSAGQ